ncbi:MAG TPA: hypothetical protein VGR14_08895 [Verrucomicrobiae bacterium]|jgi:hypothetical protein|nr:hypothetical protein [Verrucomicrobiae bacterium]
MRTKYLNLLPVVDMPVVVLPPLPSQPLPQEAMRLLRHAVGCVEDFDRMASRDESILLCIDRKGAAKGCRISIFEITFGSQMVALSRRRGYRATAHITAGQNTQYIKLFIKNRRILWFYRPDADTWELAADGVVTGLSVQNKAQP